jgi:serine/threonine-protein kinase
MFIKEAVTMAGIRHPHIAEILDFDEHDGHLYYIMDYYSDNLGAIIGESYETEKPTRSINNDRAISYTRQILSGLSRLHDASLIHRDIKPFNILITEDDQVKICDFGLSKLRNETFKGHSSLKIGSPYYAPPEQEDSPDTVDFSCDLYAVGVMLYRMLTGDLPIPPIRPPSQTNQDLSPLWDRFILKAIEQNPGKRFRNADDMLLGLDELEDHWERTKKNICEAPEWLFQDDVSENRVRTLRADGQKISRKDAELTFGTDPLMRPATPIPNDFENFREGTVRDRNTGLVWQTGGTRFPVTYSRALNFIDVLNDSQAAGLSTWRLPTVDELLSLVRKSPRGRDYCLESVFDPDQKWLWSSDRNTFITAWYVNLQLGFAGYNDFDSRYHVKAVASSHP